MPSTILRIPTVAVLFVLFAIPLPRAEARSRPNLKSVARKKERRIHELEQRLHKPYGPDAWFVFGFAIVRPDCSHGVTLISGRSRPYAYAQVRVSRSLVFRSCKVQSPRAAAELIWQAKQVPLPLRFSYRGFENEEQADAFHKLMSP